MDALHRRTGLPQHLLIEQHGCSNIEICTECKLQHFRQFRVSDTVVHYRDHKTFRYCDFCGGMLMDNIVHFSEPFHEERTELFSMYHARKCDFALVLGTSMNVQPNASYPEQCFGNEKSNMVIVNLQKTPYDHIAKIKLFCTTDLFMQLLMKELNLKNFDVFTDLKGQWKTQSKEEFFEQVKRSSEVQTEIINERVSSWSRILSS